MGGLLKNNQIKNYRDHRKYLKSAEPGEGKIGVTAMTSRQIADKKMRDAAKTPMTRQVYS